MKERPPRVYLRGETWTCDIYVKVPGRKRKKRTRFALPEAHSFEDAQSKAHRLRVVLETKLAARLKEPKVPMTLARFTEEVWTVRRRGHYKPATWRGHQQKLRVHILPRFGGVQLHEIKAMDIEIFVAELRDQKLAPTTINKSLGLLNKILNDAIRWDWLGINPMKKVDRCKVTTRRMRREATWLFRIFPIPTASRPRS